MLVIELVWAVALLVGGALVLGAARCFRTITSAMVTLHVGSVTAALRAALKAFSRRL